MFWVVVASNAGAVIYQAENRASPLEECETLANPEYQLREQDINADRPGRSFDSQGEGRHAMEPSTDAKEQAAIRFARQLSDRLEAGRLGGEYDNLVLVAAPKFLGRLRRELSEPTNSSIVYEIAQNLYRKSATEIRQHLPDYL